MNVIPMSAPPLPGGRRWEDAPDWANVLVRAEYGPGASVYVWAEGFEHLAKAEDAGGNEHPYEHHHIDLSEDHGWILVAGRGRVVTLPRA